MRHNLFLLALLITSLQASAQNYEAKVNALLAKMTLDEKIGQLQQIPGDIITGTDVKKTICSTKSAQERWAAF